MRLLWPTEFKELPKCSRVDMPACVRATALDPPDKSALAACSNKCPAETLYVDTGALCTASHFKLEKNHTYQFQLSKASTDEITAEADRIEKDGSVKEKNAGAFILEAAKRACGPMPGHSEQKVGRSAGAMQWCSFQAREGCRTS